MGLSQIYSRINDAQTGSKSAVICDIFLRNLREILYDSSICNIPADGALNACEIV